MARGKRCARPGCKRPAKPKGDYCRDACRAAAYKLREKYADGLLPVERRRLADREEKRVARSQGVIRSDVRLQWDRAVDALALWLAGHEEGEAARDWARETAEEALRPALPSRLRGRV